MYQHNSGGGGIAIQSKRIVAAMACRADVPQFPRRHFEHLHLESNLQDDLLHSSVSLVSSARSIPNGVQTHLPQLLAMSVIRLSNRISVRQFTKRDSYFLDSEVIPQHPPI